MPENFCADGAGPGHACALLHMSEPLVTAQGCCVDWSSGLLASPRVPSDVSSALQFAPVPFTARSMYELRQMWHDSRTLTHHIRQQLVRQTGAEKNVVMSFPPATRSTGVSRVHLVLRVCAPLERPPIAPQPHLSQSNVGTVDRVQPRFRPPCEHSTSKLPCSALCTLSPSDGSDISRIGHIVHYRFHDMPQNTSPR